MDVVFIDNGLSALPPDLSIEGIPVAQLLCLERCLPATPIISYPRQQRACFSAPDGETWHTAISWYRLTLIYRIRLS
jgi:hypothetical protein